MSELKAYIGPAPDEKGLAEYYLKSEADKVIKDITEGAMSMFRESNGCRGLDTKSPLGRIADVAFKHWNRVEHTMSNNRQLRLDKAELLRSNECLRTQLNSEMSRRLTDKIEYDLNIRHHKYKRCLAMADYCESQYHYYITLGNGFWLVRGDKMTRDTYHKRGEKFLTRWNKIWLALAEEPTWAKFLQLIHKEAK